MIRQISFTLPKYSRGFHLITGRVEQAIGELPEKGILHLFILHTSAALAVNENADPTVLRDFERVFNQLVPEGLPFLEHTVEGPDDMPAHIKAAMIGSSVSIPITHRRLNLGTWQGIYLCEFRNAARERTLVATIMY